MSSERVHYAIAFRVDQRDRVLLWYSDEADGVVVDTTGRLLCFADAATAVTYARENGLAVIDEEPFTYDLDELPRSWARGSGWFAPQRNARPSEQLQLT